MSTIPLARWWRAGLMVAAATLVAGCGGGIWFEDCEGDMDRIRDAYGRPDRQVNDDGYFDEAEIWYYDKLGLKVHFEWSDTKDCEVVKTHYPPKP